MPSSSKKQHNFMAAIAHSPSFAKKVGVSQSVGSDFVKADKGKKFAKGGDMAAKPAKFAKGGFTKAADGIAKKGKTKAQRFDAGGMAMSTANLPQRTPAQQAAVDAEQARYSAMTYDQRLQDAESKGMAYEGRPPTQYAAPAQQPAQPSQPKMGGPGSIPQNRQNAAQRRFQHQQDRLRRQQGKGKDVAYQAGSPPPRNMNPYINVQPLRGEPGGPPSGFPTNPNQPMVQQLQGGFQTKQLPSDLPSGFQNQFAKPMMTAAGPNPMGSAMKKGGAVKPKAYAKGGAVKSTPAKPAKTMARGGGCEVKGKTKGRYI